MLMYAYVKVLSSSMICSLAEEDAPFLPFTSDVFVFERALRVELGGVARMFLSSFGGFDNISLAALTFKSISVRGCCRWWQLGARMWLERLSG